MHFTMPIFMSFYSYLIGNWHNMIDLYNLSINWLINKVTNFVQLGIIFHISSIGITINSKIWEGFCRWNKRNDILASSFLKWASFRFIWSRRPTNRCEGAVRLVGCLLPNLCPSFYLPLLQYLYSTHNLS